MSLLLRLSFVCFYALECLLPVLGTQDDLPVPSSHTQALRLMGIDTLHTRGVTGKGTLIVVIDQELNPTWLKPLMDKRVIHEAARLPGNPYMLTLQDLTYTDDHYDRYLRQEGVSMTLLTNHKGRSRRLYADALNSTNAYNKGTGILEAVNLSAPDALLFPVDIRLYIQSAAFDISAKPRPRSKFSSLFEMILELQPPLVPFSDTSILMREECRGYASRLTNQGTMLLLPSGNGACNPAMLRPLTLKGAFGHAPCQSEHILLFQELLPKYIGFCGSVSMLKPLEAPQLSYFTQFPPPSMAPYFILAPGEELAFHTVNSAGHLAEDTRLSAAFVAGALALLREHCQEKGLHQLTTDMLFSLLHQYGNSISTQLDGNPEYKLINVNNVCEKLG
ncbi:MAG: hypothetical protein H2057_02840 [Alphaproteobacteria bacterium]|nr:hypothetical protein [Alphaproteobacteria bacterium]